MAESAENASTGQPAAAPAARRRPRRSTAPVAASDGAPATRTAAPAGQDWSTWPTYNKAALGFRDFWYPVQWARRIGSKPMQITLLGEKIALIRDGDKVRALHD